jgi:hypothetical protein
MPDEVSATRRLARSRGRLLCLTGAARSYPGSRQPAVMPSIIRGLVACFVFMYTTVCEAGNFHYECTVLSGLAVDDAGKLNRHWTTTGWVEKTFTVDRITGRVIGGPLDNAKMAIEVIDRGDSEMSFQVISRLKKPTHTSHLEINEWVKGDVKPFLGTTTLGYPGAYSGLCR